MAKKYNKEKGILKNKELTHDEFKEYLQKNGKTWARTTEDFMGIPRATRLPFVIDEDGFISNNNENTKENIPFIHQFLTYWCTRYTGNFIIEESNEGETSEGYLCDTYEFLKVGDLVDISPKLNNHPDYELWCKERKELAGKKELEIKRIDCGDYQVWNKEKSEWFWIPLIYVKRHVPETKSWEEIKEEYTLEEVNQALESYSKDV